MDKEKDLNFIKEFSKITISQVCRDLKVDRGNLMNGRASEENTNRIKAEIEKRLSKLMAEH